MYLLPRYDYKIAREYNWNVKNKASKGYEENYFFIFREGDGVYYNELETRYSALLWVFLFLFFETMNDYSEGICT